MTIVKNISLTTDNIYNYLKEWDPEYSMKIMTEGYKEILCKHLSYNEEIIDIMITYKLIEQTNHLDNYIKIYHRNRLYCALSHLIYKVPYPIHISKLDDNDKKIWNSDKYWLSKSFYDKARKKVMNESIDINNIIFNNIMLPYTNDWEL